jgi:hypothetical protein
MGAGSAGSSGSNDTQVSGNEAFYSKQKNSKINKGINVTTYGETKTGIKPADYNPEKDDTEARIEVFKTKGATDIENKKFLGASNLLKGGLKKGSVVTRTYFVDDVLTSKKSKKNIGYTQEEFKNLSSTKQEEVYKSYLDNRTSGKTDAFGNVSAGYSREKIVHTNKDGTKEFRESIVRTDGGGGDNQARANVVTTKNVGGKNILTTEGKIAEEKAKTKTAYDSRETKKRGRSKNVLTSSKGITKTSSDYSLGKTSLLGMV